jgi:aminopeptidase N
LGTCTLTVVPVRPGARRLELDAVEMEVHKVTARPAAAAPLPLDHTYDGDRLVIDLGLDRKAGEEIVVEIEYSATPRRGLYFIGPDEAYPNRRPQVWSQGQDEDSRHWFPCLDSPLDKATSELLATVPAPWVALSNGRLLERRDNGADGTITYHWRLDVPHSPYLITLAAGEYTILRDKHRDRDNREVEVAYYAPPGGEEEARRSFGRTPAMMALFSEKTGVPYPYPQYAQITVADFIFGGMENTSATTMTENTLHDARAHLDYSSEPLVAHELAHQWFGDLVTCRDWSQGWLNEGFATFMELIWAEHAEGPEEAAWERLENAGRYYKEDRERYRRPLVTNVFHEPIDLFDRHLYEKGSCVLHMLRRHLGDAGFWASVRRYLEVHATSTVETHDLARAIEQATGRNLDWFFEQWVFRAGHPELKLEHSYDEDTGLARLIVSQTQKTDSETPLFRIPTQMRYRVAGRDLTFDLEITEKQHTFFFPLSKAPEQAIFDPGRHLLARIEFDKNRRLWIRQLKNASESNDRIIAARVLAKRTEPEVVEALRSALLGDTFWAVSAEAAAALGDIRGEKARAALIEGLAIQHPKARRAVVKALGSFRHDDRVAASLESLLQRGDPSYYVEGEAALSLGRTRSPRALDALKAAADRPSFQDVIRQRVYEGMGKLRDERAIPVLLEGTRYGRSTFGRRAACAALGELGEGHTEVRETLEALLDDPDFRVRMAAIPALAEVGDARAIAALERAVARDLDGRVKRSGREAIRDLRERRKHDEQVRDLRDTVDKLQTEARALRDRLEKLETRVNGKAADAQPPPAPPAPIALPVEVKRPRKLAPAARPAIKPRPVPPSPPKKRR